MLDAGLGRKKRDSCAIDVRLVCTTLVCIGQPVGTKRLSWWWRHLILFQGHRNGFAIVAFVSRKSCLDLGVRNRSWFYFSNCGLVFHLSKCGWAPCNINWRQGHLPVYIMYSELAVGNHIVSAVWFWPNKLMKKWGKKRSRKVVLANVCFSAFFGLAYTLSEATLFAAFRTSLCYAQETKDVCIFCTSTAILVRNSKL